MNRKRRLIKQWLTIFLVLCFILNHLPYPIIYAGNNAGSNSSGGGGSVHTSDGTGMRSPGVILGLKTVENKVTKQVLNIPFIFPIN